MKVIAINNSSVNVLRIMLSGIFLISGINHVMFPEHVAKHLMESNVYDQFLYFINAEILVFATGFGLFTGGLLLLLNFFTRKVSIILMVLLVPITISVQLQGWQTAGPLFKNIAIAGGLLFFIINNFEKTKTEKI